MEDNIMTNADLIKAVVTEELLIKLKVIDNEEVQQVLEWYFEELKKAISSSVKTR